jgi:hypothetical protein
MDTSTWGVLLSAVYLTPGIVFVLEEEKGIFQDLQ